MRDLVDYNDKVCCCNFPELRPQTSEVDNHKPIESCALKLLVYLQAIIFTTHCAPHVSPNQGKL